MKLPTLWDTAWVERRRQKVLLTVLVTLNLSFAFATIFLWSALAHFLADPISWATWTNIGTVSSRPYLFEYPYVLIWGLPVLGTAMASINQTLGFRKLAKLVAVFPVFLMALVVLWWHLFREFSL
jgi:hypothetical protein